MNGNVHHDFDHPWFQTLIMFSGEALCLIGLVYQRRKEAREANEQVCINSQLSNLMESVFFEE